MEILPLLNSLTLVDGHAHSLLNNFIELDKKSFRSVFTESIQDEVISRSVPLSMSYRHMLARLKEEFKLGEDDSYLDFRGKQGELELTHTLFDRANISTILLDDGFNKESMLDLDELEKLTSTKVHKVLRIETELARLIKDYDNLDAILEQFEALAADRNVVGLKTIAAYRGGLAIEEVSESEAKDDLNFFNWKHKADREAINLDGSRAHYYLLGRIFTMAGERGLPVQVHCGIGDQDLDIHYSNPALMSAWFKNPAYASTSFVLLHCYPYIGEAAYLSSTFSNVYMDLSLAPIVVSGTMSSIYRQVLATVPYNKILAGTDGHSVPETYWYGATVTREALARAMEYHLEEGYLATREIQEIAELILSRNAIELYSLDRTATEEST